MSSSFETKLRRLENTAASINACSRYVLLMAGGHAGAPSLAEHAKALNSAFVTSTRDHQVSLLHLVNDILFISHREARLHPSVCATFTPVVARAFAVVAATSAGPSGGSASADLLGKCRKLVGQWKEKHILPKEFTDRMDHALEEPGGVLNGEADGATLLALGNDGSSSTSSYPPSWEDTRGEAAVSLDVLERELVSAGKALRQEDMDPSKRLRATAEGRAQDDAQLKVETALRSVEAAEIGVSMAADGVGGLAAVAKRVFVVGKRVREEVEGGGGGEGGAQDIRARLLAESSPFHDLPAFLASSHKYLEAQRAERKARLDAIDALSVHLQIESSGGGVDGRWEKKLTAFLEGIKGVKARVAEACAIAAKKAAGVGAPVVGGATSTGGGVGGGVGGAFQGGGQRGAMPAALSPASGYTVAGGGLNNNKNSASNPTAQHPFQAHLQQPQQPQPQFYQQQQQQQQPQQQQQQMYRPQGLQATNQYPQQPQQAQQPQQYRQQVQQQQVQQQQVQPSQLMAQQQQGFPMQRFPPQQQQQQQQLPGAFIVPPPPPPPPTAQQARMPTSPPNQFSYNSGVGAGSGAMGQYNGGGGLGGGVNSSGGFMGGNNGSLDGGGGGEFTLVQGVLVVAAAAAEDLVHFQMGQQIWETMVAVAVVAAQGLTPSLLGDLTLNSRHPPTHQVVVVVVVVVVPFSVEF